jgi:ATP-dependent exoDNAse (exonuclease V) alpha subunit
LPQLIKDRVNSPSAAMQIDMAAVETNDRQGARVLFIENTPCKTLYPGVKYTKVNVFNGDYGLFLLCQKDICFMPCG